MFSSYMDAVIERGRFVVAVYCSHARTCFLFPLPHTLRKEYINPLSRDMT